MRLTLTAAKTHDWDSMRDMVRDFVGKRKPCPFKGQNNDMSYKRFRWRIICSSSSSSSREAPVVSTPLTTGLRCEPDFELDPVCQRLELDSPPRFKSITSAREQQRGLEGNLRETLLDGSLSHSQDVPPPKLQHDVMSASRQAAIETAPEKGWTWRAGVQGQVKSQKTGSGERGLDHLPFLVLDKAPSTLQGTPSMKMAAPSLLNDFYTDVLDCSCDGLVALALGSSVYLWNSETQTLMGNLNPSPQRPGRWHHQLITSLSWSRDGRALCIGTKSGEIQLWDVEKKQSVNRLPSHLSAVGAVSWKQHLLSSGSVLGRIHHLDPRAAEPLVGAVMQTERICSLQWSPRDDWLASGSTDGFLHIWDGDIAGQTKTKQPRLTMKQPSAVKAMGWCPWRDKVIASGGGWKDGELRIWDVRSGTYLTSVDTNSQICCLRWAENKQYLVTGHGRPHHQVTCWTLESESLLPAHRLTGHSSRVLHLALNPDHNQIFSAGADHHFHVWDY